MHDVLFHDDRKKITLRDCFAMNSAVWVSIAGRQSGKVADCHYRQLSTQSRRYPPYLYLQKLSIMTSIVRFAPSGDRIIAFIRPTI